ncbi:MAG: serine/threonine-protein kinase [Acidobacteriota bacterium]|nr:serine/threonine-protein kinase [Acidobacteriota bacterium]
MNTERWPEIKTLLDQVLDLPPDEREPYLASHCQQDEELITELRAYLDLEDEAEELFETPIVDLIAGRPPEYRAGERIGPYRLDGEIARGGMGVVYKASRVQGGFHQEVAIKVLKRGFDTGDFVRRFRTEQQILADLDHPNIVRLLDGGATDDGLPYLVMESVEGTRLDAYRRVLRPDLQGLLELFLKVCDAVHVAHQHMVVHCDLKPSNILVTGEGEPKLLDFGIAKVLQQGTDGATQSLGLRLGTPPYASPEQARGEAVTSANDVYSLGALLFLLLTGRAPKAPDDPGAPLQVPSKVLEGARAASPDLELDDSYLEPNELRGDLDAITLKAMAADPDLRYSSAAALAEDLRRHLGGHPVKAQPYSWSYVFSRFVRRRRRELSIAAVILVLLLTAGVIALTQQIRAEAQETRALGIRDAYLELLEVYDPTSTDSAAEAVRTAMQELLANERFVPNEDQALIYDRIGRQFYRLGFFERGHEMVDRSLALRREDARTTPGELASSLNNLALFYLAEKDLDRAAELVEQALAIHAQHPDVDKLETYEITANLAGVYREQGRNEEAEARYRQAIAGYRSSEDAKPAELAKIVGGFGVMLYGAGRLEEAEPLLRESLELRRKVLGPTHEKVSTGLINFAAFLDARGKTNEAIAHYREALALREATFDTSNIKVASAAAYLGYALSGRGSQRDLEEAQSLLEPAIATSLQTQGPDHSDTLLFQTYLAGVLLRRGELQRTESLLRSILDRQATWKNTVNAWRIADARSLLGATLLAQGQRTAARPYLEGAAEVIAEARGEDARPAREAWERWGEWVGHQADTDHGA